MRARGLAHRERATVLHPEEVRGIPRLEPDRPRERDALADAVADVVRQHERRAARLLEHAEVRAAVAEADLGLQPIVTLRLRPATLYQASCHSH